MVVSKAPSKKLSSAPAVAAQIGKAVSLKLKGLPKSTNLSVKVKSGGVWTSLGKIKTTKAGQATVPTFTVDKAGTYSLRLTTAKGVNYYVKVLVA